MGGFLLRALLCVAAAGLLVATSGCATYSDRLDRARASAAEGDYQAGVAELNRTLGVTAADAFPEKWEDDYALAVLERGSLLQAQLDFEDSSSNWTVADEELEVLEIESDTIGQIGRYVFSDSAGVYRVPPVERLALNAANMLNFLALDDLNAAAVEARRFTVVREYLEGMGVVASGTAFGSYFAGLTFEKLGQGDRALRYYEDALRERSLTTLRDPVARLAARHSYRGPKVNSLIARAGRVRRTRPSEIVVVMSLGRVPYKVPERIPVGAAVGLAGTFISGNPEVLGYSILKVVVYPELTPSFSVSKTGSVTIDGDDARVELLVDLGDAVTREYEAIKPQIIGAAVSRMIVRAAASEGMRAAGSGAGGYGSSVGFLAALITEGTLLALDKPDTRSWSFLAERVLISRSAVAPGQHEVEVKIEGEGIIVKRDFKVTVPKGKVAVIVVTEPR